MRVELASVSSCRIYAHAQPDQAWQLVSDTAASKAHACPSCLRMSAFEHNLIVEEYSFHLNGMLAEWDFIDRHAMHVSFLILSVLLYYVLYKFLACNFLWIHVHKHVSMAQKCMYSTGKSLQARGVS